MLKEDDKQGDREQEEQDRSEDSCLMKDCNLIKRAAGPNDCKIPD